MANTFRLKWAAECLVTQCSRGLKFNDFLYIFWLSYQHFLISFVSVWDMFCLVKTWHTLTILQLSESFLGSGCCLCLARIVTLRYRPLDDLCVRFHGFFQNHLIQRTAHSRFSFFNIGNLPSVFHLTHGRWRALRHESSMARTCENAAPRDAAICQSCSCWCSCCASGCPCFCSRCLRGCCAVGVVDVVGAVLCGASRNMLVCCVCCFVARTVLMSLWAHELLTKWMQRPNIRQTGPLHSPIPSPPLPPFLEEEN